MEKSELLRKAISKIENSSNHRELNIILEKLQNNSIDSFFNEDAIQWHISNDIRSIIDSNIESDEKLVSSNVDVVAQIVFTINQYLSKGILNADVKAILIFASVNSYLQIDIRDMVSSNELEENHTQLISEKITQVIKETLFSFNASYYKGILTIDNVDEFLNYNIIKIYGYIHEIEESIHGFHINYLIEQMLVCLHQINLSSFINLLSDLQNPLDLVFCLQNLKKEDLLKIARDTSESNKWLNFELIRRIIQKENEENELETKAIEVSLERIRMHDLNFFEQTLQYFQKSKLFNSSLAKVLSIADNLTIERVISCYTIDKFHSNLEVIDYFREQLQKYSSDEQLDFIRTLMFKKWRIYLDMILLEKDFYQNKLLLTDYVNFVIDYHTIRTDPDKIIDMMNTLIEKIRFISAEWTTSISQQTTKFHLYHSELFLLTFVYKNKGLEDSNLLEKYKTLIDNQIQFSSYSVDEYTMKYIRQGKHNMNLMS